MCIGFLNFHNFRKGHYGSLCKFSPYLSTGTIRHHDENGLFWSIFWAETLEKHLTLELHVSAMNTCIELPWETFRHLPCFHVNGSFWRKVKDSKYDINRGGARGPVTMES